MEAPGALSNVTSYLPSPADLIMAIPRLLSKASSLGELLRSGGSAIAEPTAVNATNSTMTMTAGKFVQESVAAAVATASGSGEEISMFQAVKNVASFFSYITSKWAIATFAIAVLLNRTHFYASSRVPLSFDRLYLRLTLYIVPLLLFLYQIQSILQAIQCQTSPGWSEMQYGGPGRQLDTDFGGEGGYMWRASSALLFWQTTEESCRAVNMLPLSSDTTRPSGSLHLLWPLFLSLGFGQFVETLSCALQGRHPTQEVGMTIFEHSLAFAEAEAVVTKPLAMDTVRFLSPKNVFAPDGTSLLIQRSGLSRMANAPPEVLIISLISSISHLTSNVLAIAGVRSRYRLITTAIWGVAYMSTFAWSFARLASAITDPDQYIGILRFPTVCIVGFIPHLLILAGIFLCGCIYLLALVITALSLPGQPVPLTLKDRFAFAYENLHANIHLSAITPLTINWNEDFYTAILKVGFTVLTAASEAVFLNEGIKVNVHSMTWLEKERLKSLLARRKRFRDTIIDVPAELTDVTLAQGVEVTDKYNGDPRISASTSGYARERKTRGAVPTSDSARRNDPTGLGQRRSRFFLVYNFWRNILKLIALAHARVIVWSLRRVRINYLPGWLRRAGRPGLVNDHLQELYELDGQQTPAAAPWLTLDNRDKVRQDENFNIEDFATERLRKSGYYTETDSKESSDRLDAYLYSWWRNSGSWNELDTTADYVPPQDDDTTSVLSFASTHTSNSEWSDVDNDEHDDGQRTPTRDTYQRCRSSTPTPTPNDTLDYTRLSQLLDPKTKEDREEAKLLSRHLQSNTIMTRSRYRAALDKEELRVLESSRYELGPVAPHITPEEEEQFLEDLILGARSKKPPQQTAEAGNWDTGADGMGSGGPQCVVCQMAPRTVLVWPCGCLSLCDECRVGLASKNYTTCVCCRTAVVAYSRLYVP